MAYEDKTVKQHHLIMEGRQQLSISGVEDVESFDEESIVMHTSKGLLTVSGNTLHIGRLSLEGGEVDIEGSVDCLKYSEERTGGGGLFSRLFK